jgi:transcriptional antiterminator RfaH
MLRYYVVQTQPQKERTAVFELQNQGFSTFYPVIEHVPRFRRGRLEVPRRSALFPKYLFVSLNLETDPWRSVNGTRGVVRLMCMDDERPSAVPEEAMARLLAAGEVIQERAAGLPFNLGDNVEFVSGPMAGRQALVEACAVDRVQVLLELLGGKVSVKCEPKALRYLARV